MDNVQNCDIYISTPLSQAYRSFLFIYLFLANLQSTLQMEQ
jgi:hypothetical protein